MSHRKEVLISYPFYNEPSSWACCTKTKSNVLMSFLTAAPAPPYVCGWWLTFSP